ncbi:hypothetical protein [Pseudarthrobacter sp. PS3-L1]|uniref:hypothetical protein n=1 Tax=Pseudarthrobacter sp. PS3-L1 TaxID=3046207 RepID=UPI0024BAE1D1|nr:hypothetical protein [Pseudarthrobacter sp. PS3-L1]MDJ0319870.1 hypothetical protein [Pseudarthrobacter sp. PS3-L1]
MVDEQGFYGPLSYSPWWLWAGILLTALAGAWLIGVLVATRKKRPGGNTPTRPLVVPTDLKEQYLSRIASVQDAVHAGTLAQRTAHQELSLIVRGFIRDATGLDATRMTLAELRAGAQPDVADAIGQIYPGEFAAVPLVSVGVSAAAARTVVQSWN